MKREYTVKITHSIHSKHNCQFNQLIFTIDLTLDTFTLFIQPQLSVFWIVLIEFREIIKKQQ